MTTMAERMHRLRDSVMNQSDAGVRPAHVSYGNGVPLMVVRDEDGLPIFAFDNTGRVVFQGAGFDYVTVSWDSADPRGLARGLCAAVGVNRS